MSRTAPWLDRPVVACVLLGRACSAPAGPLAAELPSLLRLCGGSLLCR